MIKFTDKTISNGRNRWTVSGYASYGTVYLERIEGDITDKDGIKEAVRQHIASNAARFARSDVYA